jgi:pimeloyl-ACP methyl ester carboxylesterase
MFDDAGSDKHDAPAPNGNDSVMPRYQDQLRLQDGRAMGYAEYGAADGIPVVYCHGFPGSRFEAALAHSAARELGVRVIAFDRPGYGLSDISKYCTIQGWTRDLAYALDALGLRRVAMLGVSGGGPYALGATFFLQPRITAAAIVCALGPLDAPSARAALGGVPRIASFTGWSLPRFVLPIFGRCLCFFGGLNPALTFKILSASRSGPDARIMQRADVKHVLTTSIREALRRGSAPVLRDLYNYAHWGFDPSDVLAPVHLWHGEADTTIAMSMGRRLAERLRQCIARFIPGEGHFSLPVHYAKEILHTLITSPPLHR